MSVQPEDDAPAEVPDFVDPADAPLEPTPLDEDTSAADSPDALAALLAEVDE